MLLWAAKCIHSEICLDTPAKACIDVHYTCAGSSKWIQALNCKWYSYHGREVKGFPSFPCFFCWFCFCSWHRWELFERWFWQQTNQQKVQLYARGLSHPTLSFVLQIWIYFSRYWESHGIPLISVHLQDYFLWMVKISSDCSTRSKEGLRKMWGKQTATDCHNSVLKELITWNTVCPYWNWEVRKKPGSVVVFITKYTKMHLNYKMWLYLIECYPTAEIDSLLPVIPRSLERQITDKKWSNETTQSFHKDEFISLAREKTFLRQWPGRDHTIPDE